MSLFARFDTLATAVLLTAGSSLAIAASGPVASPHQLEFELRSGNYQCELGHKIDVKRGSREQASMQISWKGKHYNLARDPSKSGLPRYEDRKNGLVWIDLPWKGMLLDGRTNKPLANECRTA